MAYYDREHERAAQIGEHGVVSTTNRILGLLVRLIGVALLIIGAWVGLKVVDEAWKLYQGPDRVERFAAAIERGSHIDELLSPAGTAQPQDTGSGDPAAGAAMQLTESATPGNSAPEGQPTPARERFRMSYFIGWIVVLFLLLIIGRIAVWLIKTGGELALYDTEVRRFARALIEQTGGRRPGERARAK